MLNALNICVLRGDRYYVQREMLSLYYALNVSLSYGTHHVMCKYDALVRVLRIFVLLSKYIMREQKASIMLDYFFTLDKYITCKDDALGPLDISFIIDKPTTIK